MRIITSALLSFLSLAIIQVHSQPKITKKDLSNFSYSLLDGRNVTMYAKLALGREGGEGGTLAARMMRDVFFAERNFRTGQTWMVQNNLNKLITRVSVGNANSLSDTELIAYSRAVNDLSIVNHHLGLLKMKHWRSRQARSEDPDDNPSFEEVMAEQHNVFRKHPETKFINAHLGWFGNNLARLGELFDEMPNVYTEIGAVLAELGRQPITARAWLIKYQDRVLMGKDSYNKEEYYTYFWVLETSDEYFDYYRKRHAHWKMYGLALPDSVLKKIYYQNAIKVIPRIDTTLFESIE